MTDDLGSIDGEGTGASSVVNTTCSGSQTVTTRRWKGQDQQQSRTETKNVLGKVSTVTDAKGVTITYAYDADGNLTAAGDPAGGQLPTVHIGYDQYRGWKTSTVDPDLGTWTYEYNGFGDLIAQTDAANHRTTMTYDRLGRMTSRNDGTGTAFWVYDAATNGKGKLAGMVSASDNRLNGPCSDLPYGLPTDGKRAARWFMYTGLGDVQEAFECTDGETFSTQYEYDNFGRQLRVHYPEVKGQRLVIEYRYTSLGFLWYLTDASDGSLYWVATSMNAAGQVTGEKLRNGVETVNTRNPATGWLMGSSSVAHADGDRLIQSWGYHYDELGNLTWRGRADAVNAASSEEIFGYDPLNRLTTSQVKIAAQGYDVTEPYTYDDIGNLKTKGAKTLAYGGNCLAGSRAAGPHAVCTVDGGASYRYDANGNLTSGNGHDVTYNRANKPDHIAPTSGDGVDFIYGADGNRVVQAVGTSGSTARTVYVGMGGTGKDLYERTVRGSTTEHVHFIYAGGAHGGGAFALKVLTDDGSPTPAAAEKYYHVDHLGSVTAVSDEWGRVVDATWGGSDAGVMGYDPWGARRSADGQAADPTSFKLQTGHREFTGHETIPGVTLVNMNGRVYDPVIGRFMSPDPNVQFQADLQSYNRYAYVLNNPLRYTDPTGYSVFAAAWMDWAVGATLGLVTTAACVGTGGAGCAFLTVLGAVYSTTTMAAAGASFEQIVTANAVGLLAGNVGGALGGIAAQPFAGNPAASILAGAISGSVSAALSSVITGQKLGWNILEAAAMGAASGAVAWALTPTAPVAQVDQEAAQGGSESGAGELENDARSEAVAGPASQSGFDTRGALALDNGAEGASGSRSDANSPYENGDVPTSFESRKPGKTPPKLWPAPPESVVGKKPTWNPDGYWEGKGRNVTWDDRSHGAGIDRGGGIQGGHWDDENSGNRWRPDGSLLPGSPGLKAATAVSAGYLIYRIVRLLPSIFAPPTIVPNLAAP